MAENRSRTSVDRAQHRAGALASIFVATIVVAIVLPSYAPAQMGNGGGGAVGPTYQRKGEFAGHGQGHHGDHRRREFPQYSSHVKAGSYQRPYPFHLDYYRMKWGGSYAPYFGNLYGPPINNFFGTPFLGDSSPFYGYNGYGFNGNSWGGFPGGNGFGYGGPGFGGPGFGGPGFGGPIGNPNGPWMGPGAGPFAAPVEGEVVEQAVPVE